MDRVIAYIDGYNLYYGLRSRKWQRFYWLNLQEMVRCLLKADQTLVRTKYFTSIVADPPDQHDRQAIYLDALRTLSNFAIFYGRFLDDTTTCRKCGHSWPSPHEKMTDVNIAVELMTDAFQNRFDVALLVSGDSDLVALVRAVHRLFHRKRIVSVFPPNRSSKALKKASDAFVHVTRHVMVRSVFPDRVIKPDGFVLRRPSLWR